MSWTAEGQVGRMEAIRWEQLPSGAWNGFAGEELVATVQKADGSWQWQVKNNPALWQASSGRDFDAETAVVSADGYWSDHLAISDEDGLLKWRNPAKDVWIAFSGSRSVGTVMRLWGKRDGKDFEVHTHANGTFRHYALLAFVGREIVEKEWAEFLKACGLVKAPRESGQSGTATA